MPLSLLNKAPTFKLMAITLAKTKELLKRPDMSDEEAEKIRDDFRALAEIIFESWKLKKVKTK